MTTIALVTGASRGLGLETARRLGQAGATVLIAARDAQAAARAVDELCGEQLTAEWVQLDVTSDASVRAAADHVDDRFGRLDILVNNAGILPEATHAGYAGPIDADAFRTMFDTNLFGAVAVSECFLPLLHQSDAGRIVNVSSTMGSLSEQLNPNSPYYGLIVPAYQASKAGLNSLTIALAKALAETAIKVNSVCPGWLQTDLGGPDNRAAAPTSAAEGAAIVAELALISQSGPTGLFVDRDGSVAW